jgi:hypothetical protein
MIGTFVQPDEEAFDDRARNQIKPPDGGQHCWTE